MIIQCEVAMFIADSRFHYLNKKSKLFVKKILQNHNTTTSKR